MRALLLAAVVAFSTAGRANVIYSFDPTVVTILHPDRTPGGYYAELHGRQASFSFELADAAIRRGSFSIDGSAMSGATQGSFSFRGDVEDFVGFTGPEASFSATSIRGGYGSLNMTLTFDAYGNVLGGSMRHVSYDEMLTFSFSNNFVTGVWQSEYPSCWSGCSEIGALTIQHVPEPASLALLGFGLAGLAARRRAA